MFLRFGWRWVEKTKIVLPLCFHPILIFQLTEEKLKCIKGATHTIKGTAANLMCRELSESARVMEEAIMRGAPMNGAPGSLLACFSNIQNEYFKWCSFLP